MASVKELLEQITSLESEFFKSNISFEKQPLKLKSSYETYLAYLQSLQVMQNNEVTQNTQLIEKTVTVLDVINTVVKVGGKVTLVSPTSVKFFHKANSYTLDMLADKLKLTTYLPQETYQSGKVLNDFRIFNTEVVEYIKPEIDHEVELIKANSKTGLDYLTIGSSQKTEVVTSTKQETHIQRNIFNKTKVKRLEELQAKLPIIGSGQDIVWWLKKVVIYWDTPYQINALKPYLFKQVDSVFDLDYKTWLDYYMRGFKTEKFNNLGVEVYRIYWNFDSSVSAKLFDILEFIDKPIFIDEYLGNIGALQCPKRIALGILTDEYIHTIGEPLSTLASCIKLDISKSPIIDINGNNHRVYDAFFPIHLTEKSINKTINTRIHNNMSLEKYDIDVVNTPRGRKNLEPHSATATGKASTLVRLSRESLDKIGSEYNGCFVYFESIAHCYDMNAAKQNVIDRTIKNFCATIKVTNQKNILGRIIVKSEYVREVLGVVVVKKNKLWYFQLPQSVTSTHHVPIGDTINKIIPKFTIHSGGKDEEGKLLPRTEVKSSYTKQTSHRTMYMSEAVTKTEFKTISSELVSYLSLHGLRDNTPITPSKIVVKWDRVLQVKLELADADSNTPYKVTTV